MQKKLLDYLCDPVDKSDLTLKDAKENDVGHIISGELVSESGNTYPIINGIPRFVKNETKSESVKGFGDQWNDLNFHDFKPYWLSHTVKNTFGNTDYFKGKIVVDCGAGHGMQSKWMSESGADYVIALELSHAVDDVFQRNLKGVNNIDIVQCSIDCPPIKDNSIKNGLVICHNVIQHTPSVEKTALALWQCVGEGSEFVFNCYRKYNKGIIRKIRWEFYQMLRNFLSKKTHEFRYNWCIVVSALRMVPGLGWFMEKSMIATEGDIIGKKSLKKRFRVCFVITFDGYGGHKYQHHLTKEELDTLIHKIQPNESKIKNKEAMYSTPPKIGAGYRIFT